MNKKGEADRYFGRLKFLQEIEYMDLEIKIDTELIYYKLERENDLDTYFKENIKDWEEQIERANGHLQFKLMVK